MNLAVEEVILDMTMHEDFRNFVIRKMGEEVDLELSDLDLTSAETKATYEEIKAYIKEKYDLNVSNLYIAQIKEECGILERENYNLPKGNGSKKLHCPIVKRDAILDVFEHFKMI